MQVTVEPMKCLKQTRWGEVEQIHGHSRVRVNGNHAGIVVTDARDPYFGVFHPVAGFPKELVADVVDNSPTDDTGRKIITGTLQAPAMPPEELTDEDDE